ncbi:hypothetical protein HYU07_06590 [Candidatus Woesearchaeota archaeon]|nr:hypothetical protein [Candidatus Woesearchaeota archaeon]
MAGDELIYSLYRTRFDLVEAYQGREINAVQFLRSYIIMQARDMYRRICDRIALLKERRIKPTDFEKRLLRLGN